MSIQSLDSVKANIYVVGGFNQLIRKPGPLHEQKIVPLSLKVANTDLFRQLR
jgi:hypothetical protein